MKASSNKKGEDVKHYPYFRREQTFDTNITTAASYSYRYTLLGIARITTTGLDIYDSYFLRRYKKKYDYDIRLTNGKVQISEKEHLSIFFKYFIEIMAIKSQLGVQKNSSRRINTLVNDLFDSFERPTREAESVELQPEPFSREKEVEELRECVKSMVSNILELQQKMSTDSDGEQVKQIERVGVSLKEKLQQISDYLDTHREQIKKSEYLPKVKNYDTAKKIIMDNYKKIINIEAFRAHSKKDILSLFLNINRSFLTVKIPLISESQDKPDKNKVNEIILAKYSNDSDDRQLLAVTLLSKVAQASKIPKKELLSLRFELIKDLVCKITKYHKSTNHFFPNLAIDHIYFDQKAQKIFLSHTPLLLDALGLHKKTKHFQLELATETTPELDFEKCHLQFEEENQILLKKKYCFPNDYRRRNEDHEQGVESEAKETKQLAQLEENINVWRLINVIYFISNNQVMTKALYGPYFPDTDKTKKPPFSLPKYKQIIAQIYHDFSTHPETIINLLLPIKYQLQCTKILSQKEKYQESAWDKIFENLANSFPDALQIQDRKSLLTSSNGIVEPFNFTLNMVCKLFDISEDDDSILQNLKLKSAKSQIHLRLKLVKQIHNFLIDKKIFKKMINAKKYLLLYIIYIMEDIYLLKMVRNNSNSSPHFKSIHFREFEKEYSTIVFSTEFERRKKTKNTCWEKLQQYKKRDDPNKDFLKKSSKIIDNLIRVNDALNKITQRQRFLEEYFGNEAIFAKRAQNILDSAENNEKAASSQQRDQITLQEAEIKEIKRIKHSIEKNHLLATLIKHLNQFKPSQNHSDQFVLKALLENALLFTQGERKQIYYELFKDTQPLKLVQLISIAISKHLSPQSKHDLFREQKPILIDRLAEYLSGENLNKQTITSIDRRAKGSIILNAQRVKNLMSILKSWKVEIEASVLLQNFKEKWMVNIEMVSQQLYNTLLVDLDKLANEQIEVKVNEVEAFHKKADFQSKSPEHACLYYNHKLLTLIRLYLMLNEHNWRIYELHYTSYLMEDKVASLPSKTERQAKDRITEQIARMEILRKIKFEGIKTLSVHNYSNYANQGIKQAQFYDIASEEDQVPLSNSKEKELKPTQSNE